MFTKISWVTERSTNQHGRLLLAPEITVEGWWANLELPEKRKISAYQSLGLSEQFHSEFKTDLDLERLPSSKFATNADVMALCCFACNILRFIGRLGSLGEKSPVRPQSNAGNSKQLFRLINIATYQQSCFG